VGDIPWVLLIRRIGELVFVTKDPRVVHEYSYSALDVIGIHTIETVLSSDVPAPAA
jgi:hypothetical protein